MMSRRAKKIIRINKRKNLKMTKQTKVVSLPATEAAAAVDAAPANPAKPDPTTVSGRPHLGYSDYYGANYGRGRTGYGVGGPAGAGYRSHVAYSPPATPHVVKTAKERTWEEHQEVRAKIVRQVSMTEMGMQTLLSMLTYARPHSSPCEQAFIDRYIVPLPGCQKDSFGNHWVTIKQTGAKKDLELPNILWSCHTDTVHRKGGTQKIVVGDGIVTAKDNNCLGGDCTAGVWIMTEMIKSRIPGTYIFHRQEEIGGRGSAFIAKTYADELALFDAAIAFDRRGLHDIITHQGDLCASDTFAASLALALNGNGLKLSPCRNGVFTDTANYTEIIGECTNLSVGYFSEHQSVEFLSLGHLFSLRDAIIKADLSKLAFTRKPGEGSETGYWRRGRTGGTVTYAPSAYVNNSGTVTPAKTEYQRLLDFIKLYPADVARVLDGMNVTTDDMFDMIGLLDARHS